VINMDAPYWTVPLHHRYLRLLAWFGANGSRLPTVADMPYLRMISGFDERGSSYLLCNERAGIFVDHCAARIFYFIRDYSLAYSTTSRIQEADAPNEGPQYMAARSLLLSQPIWSGLEPNADLTVQPGSEIQTEEGRGKHSAYQLVIYLPNVLFLQSIQILARVRCLVFCLGITTMISDTRC